MSVYYLGSLVGSRYFGETFGSWPLAKLRVYYYTHKVWDYNLFCFVWVEMMRWWVIVMIVQRNSLSLHGAEGPRSRQSSQNISFLYWIHWTSAITWILPLLLLLFELGLQFWKWKTFEVILEGKVILKWNVNS